MTANGDFYDCRNTIQSMTHHDSQSTLPSYSDEVETQSIEPLFDDQNLIQSNETTFPDDELAKLEEQMNRPKWSIPVFHNGELIKCLRSAIVLVYKNLDTSSVTCQRFIWEDIIVCFTRILTDDAVNSWENKIQLSIYKNSLVLIRLTVLKLHEDCLPLFEILSHLMNPSSRFNSKNIDQSSFYRREHHEEQARYSYADNRYNHRWICDFINKFGDCSGFERLCDRLTSTENKLSVQAIIALVKPWGLCYDYLSHEAIRKYFFPIIKFIPQYLNDLNEPDMKFDNKVESKDNNVSSLIKWLRNIASRIRDDSGICRNLDIFQQKLILRFLQTNSFNGKMHALNQLNKLIQNVEFYYRPFGSSENSDDVFTSEKCVKWLQENNVLDLVLRDCLHQPQYVEKLEQLIRFLAREKALTRNDLDKIWSASSGKHEAIEKNVHDLLAKSAWYLSVEQLEQLFDCFRESWTKATKKQREKLLELIRRLAEDDKEGNTANKILDLLWVFSYDSDLMQDIADLAVTAHLKILDGSFVHDREKTKLQWMDRLIEQIKENRQVILSLRHLRELCCQFSDYCYPSHSSSRSDSWHNRIWLIGKLEEKHQLMRIIADNLCQYMQQVREQQSTSQVIAVPSNHQEQIQARLGSIKFLSHEGRIKVNYEICQLVWETLATQSIYPIDLQKCFDWISELSHERLLDYRVEEKLFEENLLKFDPHLLTESGMNCFDLLYKNVNTEYRNFHHGRNGLRLKTSEHLIGIEFLWQLVVEGSDMIAARAINLIKDTYTNISGSRRSETQAMHLAFIKDCFIRLNTVFEDNDAQRSTKLVRILRVLHEYIVECDRMYKRERRLPPSFRAFRGRNVVIHFRINPGQDRQIDEFEHYTHSNEVWGSIRRLIRYRHRGVIGNLEIHVNNELILSPHFDQRTICPMDNQERIYVHVRWLQSNSAHGSSDDSSSSDSDYNQQHYSSRNNVNYHNMDFLNSEQCLPSVILSQNGEFCEYLLKIFDLGCETKEMALEGAVRYILDQIPICPSFANKFLACFVAESDQPVTLNAKQSGENLRSFIFVPSPSSMFYAMRTLLATLFPANATPERHCLMMNKYFIESSGIKCLLDILDNPSLTNKFDTSTRISIYSMTIYLLRRYLALMCFHKLRKIENPDKFQYFAMTIGQNRLINEQGEFIEFDKEMLSSVLSLSFLDDLILTEKHFYEILFLSWRLGSNVYPNPFAVDFSEIDSSLRRHGVSPINEQYIDLDERQTTCRDAIDLISLAGFLLPSSIGKLFSEEFFKDFFIGLIVFSRKTLVRRSFAEQIHWICTLSDEQNNQKALSFVLNEQFSFLKQVSGQIELYANQLNDFFHLFTRLLALAGSNRSILTNLDEKLNEELVWIKNATNRVHDSLIRGHLCIAKELFQLDNSENRFQLVKQLDLIPRLIEEFLFPASHLLHKLHSEKDSTEEQQQLFVDSPDPICQTQMATVAALDLLIAFSVGSYENLSLINDYLNKFFHHTTETNVNEFDTTIPINARPLRGFVGLKNPGATCYMNSVLQQLFMIRPLRTSLLAIQFPAEYEPKESEEVDANKDKKSENSVNQPEVPIEQRRKLYHIEILRQIQIIFGHLLDSKLQFYAPKAFWKVFKFGNELVNTREQHDAIEFFNMLVDSVDEGLKSLSLPPICSRILGGKFADQKICKDCPHRYTREEDFTLISVDIRHSQNLRESLDQYVLGDFLEGPNAYLCEKCAKKVNTVKRTCFKTLPPILVIQLKRFDYDWEHETPIKFNDYFEFPRELDMEPYTVQGLAKAEGTTVDDEMNNTEQTGTKYNLSGIIVHMGQANGGHYYSYIKNKQQSDSQWFRFDDTEVLDCRMDDDEELRSQCFGGDHTPTISDPHLPKKQRRWWNGYILFYEKVQETTETPIDLLAKELSETSLYDPKQRMPLSVQCSVREQNNRFLHNRCHFSPEYFQFIRKLSQQNINYLRALCYSPRVTELPVEFIDKYSLILTEIIVKFLFSTGWKTKKTLRGSAADWTDMVVQSIQCSKQSRSYLIDELINRTPNRFQEYFIDCTFAEIRQAFSRLLLSLIDLSRNDESIENAILHRTISLLRQERTESLRVPSQLFGFFYQYAGRGIKECTKLIASDLPFILTSMVVNDSPMISPRMNEWDKFYPILSCLIRNFDVRSFCRARQENSEILPNPYSFFPEDSIEINEKLSSMIFGRQSFFRKLIDDVSNEDSSKLFLFLLWENPRISKMIFDEISTMIHNNNSLDPEIYVEVFRNLLHLEDSWQEARFVYFLNGTPMFSAEMQDDHFPIPLTPSSGSPFPLVKLIRTLKNSNQQRVYQLVKVFCLCLDKFPHLNQILKDDEFFRNDISIVFDFLHDYSARGHYQTSNDFYSTSKTNRTSIDDAIAVPKHYERSSSPKQLLEILSGVFNDQNQIDEEEDLEEEDADLSSPDEYHRSIPTIPTVTSNSPENSTENPQDSTMLNLEEDNENRLSQN